MRQAHKLPELQKLLSSLLEEGVSIKYPVRILEALSHRQGLKGQMLTEVVRGDIARLIAEPLRSAEGELVTLALAGHVEAELKSSFQGGDDGGEFLAIPTDLAGDLLSAVKARSNGIRKRGLTPCLVVARRLRPHLLKLFRRDVPDLRVLAYEEADGIPLRIEARLDRFERPQVASNLVS